MQRCSIWIVLLASAWQCSAMGQTRPRRLRYSEAHNCSATPGTSPGHYIVGERAWKYFEERNQTHLATKAWFKDNPIRIQKGCTFNYRLEYGDEVHLVVEKEERLSEMWFEYDQEKQAGTTQYQSMMWYVAWEEYMEHYNTDWGGIPEAFESGYIVYLDSSELNFPTDQSVEHVGEQRRDIYHMKNATARWVEGDTYQEEEHMGDLRVCLYANHPWQMIGSIYKPEELLFMGTNTWHEHPPTGKIRQDQYEALKTFYKEACAPYRGPNPPAYNQPWHSEWSRTEHIRDVSEDYDDVPYCTWLQDGWNDTYWSQHLDVDGGACHMITGIWCDQDGYIDEVRLPHMGLQGDLGKLLNALPHLRELQVAFNALSGTIPKFLETQKELYEFVIWHNHIHGTVPCFSSDTLWNTDIAYNQLTGSLPQCPNGEDVHDLWVEHNDLTGELPKAWKGYVNFRNMGLAYNRISGSIPLELCNLTKLWYMFIEGNVLTGTIPDEMLANTKDKEGLFNIYAIHASHNRFSGPLPRINGNKAEELGSGGGVRFAHNFFTGTYTGQWDDYLEHDEGAWWGTTFEFRNNLLSGPLPEIFRTFAMKNAGGGNDPWVRWYFESNFFRCEPDGRWPDWVNRRVDTWVAQGIGKCMPVAHPTKLGEASLVEGQVAMLSIHGSDFVARGSQRCRFNPIAASGASSSTRAAMTTPAIRDTDNLIRCLVPADLSKGTYEVQVSNFGDDWSSSALIEGYNGHPRVEVAEAPSLSTHLNVTMVLTTDSQSRIDSATMQTVVTDMLGFEVEISNFAAETSSANSTRRLQSGEVQLLINFHLLAAQGDMQEVKAKLENHEAIEGAFHARGVHVVVKEVSVRSLKVTNAAGSTDEKKETDVVLIIVACATLLVACGLCGFILFLYRMERSGKAYFKESLDDVGNTEQPSSAPPQKIGASDVNDGNDV